MSPKFILSGQLVLGWLLSACLELPALSSPATEAVVPGFEADGGSHDSGLEAVPEGASSTLRIGTWNVRRLGRDERTNVALVATLIERHFDVLALVEVMQTGAGTHRGLDDLMSALGPNWSSQATATPRPNQDTPFAEFYAVIFRVARVQPCNAAQHLAYSAEVDGSIPAQSEGNRFAAFLREPAFGCFRSTRPEGRGFDFMLGVYHARYGSGSVPEIAREVSQIDAVLADVARQNPAERDILLLGDFNLSSGELARSVDAHDATSGTGSTLNRDGERSENLLDHLLILDLPFTHELVAPAEVLDLRSQVGAQVDYLERVSDHLPIRALFDEGPDDD